MRVIGWPSRRLARATLLASALLALAGAPSAAEPAPDRIEAARRRVLDDSYQAELPGQGSGSSIGTPRRAANGQLDDLSDRRLDAREHDEPTGVSSLISTVLWGLMIVILALVAFWLVSELTRGDGDVELSVADDDTRARLQAASAAIIERPLGDADELARRGAFAEAIHTLLLRTLQELARTAAVRIAPAMTSREVLARVPVLADTRTALAGLITAVELTHFGDEPANADDYARCREQFHVFAQAFRSGQVRGDARAVAA